VTETHCSGCEARGLLVLAFWYPSGLSGTIGDLLLLPGSHVIDGFHRLSLAPLFGTAALPGTVTIDAAPAGSVVLIHGGLLHARRAQPGGGGDSARYFVDVAYCSTADGERWPAYRYWRPDHADSSDGSYGVDVMGRVSTVAVESLRKAGKEFPAGLFEVGQFYDEGSATVAEAAGRVLEVQAGNA
jgi:hypothetical protein